ncbi:MAG: extracellular solute-binding protein [Oscillospiraceae bacterium]|jgi:putative aldouronate transport system substrate-binding protein|nr:extracellular solute-binding protein [Oscillospiraceae bacterium]
MKKSKILTLILAASLTASALASCNSGGGNSSSSSSSSGTSSSTPTSSAASSGGDSSASGTDGAPLDLSEKLTYTAMAGFRPQHADFKDMDIVNEVNAAANIDITWELVPDASLTEKKNLALSTGDVPDVMLGILGDTDIQRNTKLFLALDDYTEYTPNMNQIMADDENVRSFMTLSDGHYYSLAFWHEKPYEGAYSDLYINNKWLDACELEMPNTVEEFEAMLVAFKTKDPNGNGEADEIPFTFIQNHQYFGLYSLYLPFGTSDQTNRLDIKDGQVYFTANNDAWKEGTKWIAKLYDQGLLDVEGFTQDRSMLFAKGKSDPVMLGSLFAFLIDNVVGADRVPDYSYCQPLENVNGDGGRVYRYNNNPIAGRATSVISKNCKNPERLIYWLDLNLLPEYSLQNTYGTFGQQLLESTDAAYEYEFAIAPEGMSQDDYRFKGAPANFPAYIPADLYATLKPAPDVARKISYMESSADYLTKESIPPVLFTDDESKELSTLQTALQDYVLQQQARWVTNQGDIESEWEGYLAQLETMGVERYVQIYQDATDRYYGK